MSEQDHKIIELAKEYGEQMLELYADVGQAYEMVAAHLELLSDEGKVETIEEMLEAIGDVK